MGFRGNLSGLLASTAIICTIATAAHAQSASYNIKPQSMDSALTEFGLQSGQSIAFTADMVGGLSTQGVAGQMENEAALKQLLNGSNLTYRRIPNGFAIMTAKPAVIRAAQTETKETAAPPVAPPQMAADNTDIVVTAQGRTESLQTVPLSVSVTTGEMLQKSAIANLDDFSSHISGVKITDAPASNLLNIRGIGSGLNPGFEQSVGTFVDGVYRGRARAIRAALFDIERVEVLKGPQTTFFGNNTIAGAFNITTRKPGHEFSYNASALYGTYGQYAIEGGVTVPLSETLSVRVAGKAYGQNGYVKNDYTGKDGPRQRDWIGRISAQWEPTSNFTSRLRVDRGRMRDTDQFVSELLRCPPSGGSAAGLCGKYITQNGGPVDDKLNLRRNGFPGKYNYDFVEVAWNNELKLGDFTLQANTGYFDHNVINRLDPWPVPVPGVGGFDALLPFNIHEKYHSFSQELRIISPDDKPITYLAGAYYSHGKLSNDQYYGNYFLPFGAFMFPLFSATDLVAQHYTFDQKDTVKSVFASATAHLTDSLRISGGLRYSVVHKKAARSVTVGTATTAGYVSAANFVPGDAAQQALAELVLGYEGANFPNPTRTDKKLMPSVSVQYDVAPDVMAYASFTKGFKAGGFSDGSIINPFNPENVNAYEIGLKSSFLDRRLTMNIAAFWSDFTGLQETSNVAQANGTNLEYVANAGKARSRGVELESTLRPTDRLSFQASVAYLDTKYTYFPNGPCTVAQTQVTPNNCTQDLSGKPRPFAPKWSGSVSANYGLPLGGNILTFEPAIRFSSSFVQQVNNDPLLKQRGYAKGDLRIAYAPEDRHWEIAVIGTNLTDKITGSFRNTLGTSPGSIYALPEPGRSVLLQLSIRR